ncbi:hypothetical protein [Citrobacter amalonaticus]|uniref:hypothetical protein n=1 Tax=Citrobacter amalonaticus TaxID=35703 RepID=UPI0022972C00|nr:hypothetical protein [Citrobacter amalonaticus]
MKEDIKIINIIDNGIKKKAEVRLNEVDSICRLELFYNNGGDCIVSEGNDYFSCLVELRKKTPHIKFLCKGAKINVYPSNMARQMSQGMVAYELVIGKQATSDNIVHTFDFDDEDIAENPDEQIDFYKKWVSSLRR